jgi:transcriptional regulator with GAF, ATPase, and Fis domain
VAATNRDLASMAAEGTFRADLWYRIAVFPVRLPPLRERREDIPALANHFAKQAAAKFALPLALPGLEDIQLLTSYSWPGNIREFGAVVDRAAILGQGLRLDVAQALNATISPTEGIVEPAKSEPIKVVPITAAPIASAAENLELDAAMRRHIQTVLTIAHGRIEGRRGAADLLKINPHTLRARMRKLGIDWSKFRRSEDD